MTTREELEQGEFSLAHLRFVWHQLNDNEQKMFAMLTEEEQGVYLLSKDCLHVAITFLERMHTVNDQMEEITRKGFEAGIFKENA